MNIIFFVYNTFKYKMSAFQWTTDLFKVDFSNYIKRKKINLSYNIIMREKLIFGLINTFYLTMANM